MIAACVILVILMNLASTFEEVKAVEVHATKIDVLVNDALHEGDHIVVCGIKGSIATTIRPILTHHPKKELRVKEKYWKFEMGFKK